jgi:hypothetical protein
MIETAQTNPNVALPFFQLDSSEEKAKLLHRLLLDLSKNTLEKEAKWAYRSTADFFRERLFGVTETQIKLRITGALEEYFDGETYRPLEIDNLAEITGIAEEKLLPVLEKLVADGTLIRGRRRRWQEMGKHYNPIYKLNEENRAGKRRKNG